MLYRLGRLRPVRVWATLSGRRSIASASRGDGKCQLQRRLVGLVSDRPMDTLLACADQCNIEQPLNPTVDEQTVARSLGNGLPPDELTLSSLPNFPLSDMFLAVRAPPCIRLAGA